MPPDLFQNSFLYLMRAIAHYNIYSICPFVLWSKATAEVDYILAHDTHILPFEVKAGVQGGMESLWDYMRERNISQAIRCSLENFGQFDYTDDKVDGAIRHVQIFPLYAIQAVDSSLTLSIND